MSDPTETDGPTADSGSRTETVPDGPTADSGSRAETLPDAPIADSGSREWPQRFLKFGFWSVFAIAEIAWLTMLAWATFSLTRWLFF